MSLEAPLPNELIPYPIQITLRVTSVFEKLDIFILGSDAWSHEEIRLRELKPLLPGDDSTARYVSNPETTILQKLLWYRKGGEVSEKQWKDVLGILKVKSPTLDYVYLRDWAEELSIDRLLDKALADAGLANS